MEANPVETKKGNIKKIKFLLKNLIFNMDPLKMQN